MFCLYTLPLARPAQAKVQMLTTSSCIVKLIPWNLVNLSYLYHNTKFLSKFIFYTFCYFLLNLSNFTSLRPGEGKLLKPVVGSMFSKKAKKLTKYSHSFDFYIAKFKTSGRFCQIFAAFFENHRKPDDLTL